MSKPKSVVTMVGYKDLPGVSHMIACPNTRQDNMFNLCSLRRKSFMMDKRATVSSFIEATSVFITDVFCYVTWDWNVALHANSTPHAMRISL